jgi:hypothetical protein
MVCFAKSVNVKMLESERNDAAYGNHESKMDQARLGKTQTKDRAHLYVT